MSAELSLNTRPWSRVFLGGELLGTTPLGAVAIPAGAVRLKLVDRDGRVHHRRVEARPGAHVERFFDLSASSQ